MLGRGHPLQHGRVEGLHVDADRVDAPVGHLVDHGQVVGRLELDLHRQARRLLHGLTAAGRVQGALVGAVGGAGGEGDVHRAVELFGRGGHLGELGRALHRHRVARGQRHADPAEAALVVVAPVGAGLEHGAGQRVEVHEGELPVGDAVGGGEAVEAGAVGGGGLGQAHPVGVDAEPGVGGLKGVGGVGHEPGVHRHRHRRALDPDHPGVGGAGPARAALERGVDPQPPVLQIDDEVGQLHGGGGDPRRAEQRIIAPDRSRAGPAASPPGASGAACSTWCATRPMAFAAGRPRTPTGFTPGLADPPALPRPPANRPAAVLIRCRTAALRLGHPSWPAEQQWHVSSGAGLRLSGWGGAGDRRHGFAAEA